MMRRLATVLALALQLPTQSQIDDAKTKIGAIIDGLYKQPTVTKTTFVSAGSDLQAALNKALPGETLTLQAGATFTGNFTLPLKSGTSMVTIRSSAPDAALPPAGTRITPAYAAQLPKLVSPNNQPALQFAASAHHYTLFALELSASSNGEVFAVGGDRDTQTTLAQVPHDIVIDRVFVHGDSITGSKRGIGLHGATVSVLNSYISDIKASGQDSQAIAGWNGPGPYTISNNYLEGAGENLLFGGSDPGILNNTPTDITITNNDLVKPLMWRTQTQWNVKNLLELKNARKVTISGNRLSYNWSAAQQGWAVMFTPRNQDGRCPWCTVEHVVYANNVLSHSAAAISISGDDDGDGKGYTSGRLTDLLIAHSRFEDIDRVAWTGSNEATRQAILITRGPVDVTFDDLDFSGANWGQGIYLDGPTKAVRFKVTNVRFPLVYWGQIFGANASADSPFGPQGAWTLFVDPNGSTYSNNTVR